MINLEGVSMNIEPSNPRPRRSLPAPHLPAGYGSFLSHLKDRIRTAQVGAALSVNRELVLLYWDIVRQILERQENEGWGAKVIERLARDLRVEFPEMRGLSPRNLLFMRAFAKAYQDEQIVKQLVSSISKNAMRTKEDAP